MANVVLAGADEAALLTGTGDRLRAAEWFHKQGASTVILTEGASGAWGSDQETTVHSEPAPQGDVRDPVGAGDAFAAGFLSGWLRGMPLAAAMGEATIVAAAVVQVSTDIDGLPTAAERDAMVAGGEGVSR